MEKILTEKSLDTMERKLARYRNLWERREKIRKWLEKAEEHRGTVDDKIYQKVKTEYNQQLSETISDLAPLEKEINDERDSVQRRLTEAQEELHTLQEQQAETAFRHRIGEYDGEKLREIETSLSPMINEKKQQEETCSSLLRRIEESTQNSAPQADQGTSFADEVISVLADPVDDQSWDGDAGSESEEPALENKELIKDKEDGPSSGDSAQEGAAQTDSQMDADQMIPFPNLIITSGNQSGKKIPLLPMTMTIGREHDNNIELKDEEVARYHARVVYENNRFVLQDLSSSTGTWVNGEQISQASLNNKDKIRFGKTEMIIDFS